MMRYQPSPKGAMKAKASPVPLTVSRPSGFSLRRTSARTMDLMTACPGKGSPRAERTALRWPSVPTT